MATVFGHPYLSSPRSLIPSDMDFPIINFAGSIECVPNMDRIKYGNILECVKNRVYLPCFFKQEKLVLRKFENKIAYDAKSNSLFYLDKARDGTVNRQLVIQENEKSKVFNECHSAHYAGHKITKIPLKW